GCRGRPRCRCGSDRSPVVPRPRSAIRTRARRSGGPVPHRRRAHRNEQCCLPWPYATPSGGDVLSWVCHRMSRMRQSAEPELLVRPLAVGYPSATTLERHSHSWAQLVYASEGVMTVQTEEGTWVVPSHRAVWIPAGVAHSIAMSGWVSMRTL